jgi:hypothetical protein
MWDAGWNCINPIVCSTLRGRLRAWNSGHSGRSGGPVPPVWWFSARADDQDPVIEGMRSASSSCLHHHGSTVTRHLPFFLCGDNLDLIRAKAENFEVIRSERSNVSAVLSDAAGKYEEVHTAEESNVCADSLAYGNRKDIQRESGARIVRADTLFERLHIAFARRKSEEAALMIEHLFKPVGVRFLGAQSLVENAGI